MLYLIVKNKLLKILIVFMGCVWTYFNCLYFVLGPSTVLSFVAAMFVAMMNALVFAEFSTYIPHTGAAYIYIYRVSPYIFLKLNMFINILFFLIQQDG